MEEKLTMNKEEINEHYVLVVPTRCLHFFRLSSSFLQNRHCEDPRRNLHEMIQKSHKKVHRILYIYLLLSWFTSIPMHVPARPWKNPETLILKNAVANSAYLTTGQKRLWNCARGEGGFQGIRGIQSAWQVLILMVPSMLDHPCTSCSYILAFPIVLSSNAHKCSLMQILTLRSRPPHHRSTAWLSFEDLEKNLEGGQARKR